MNRFRLLVKAFAPARAARARRVRIALPLLALVAVATAPVYGAGVSGRQSLQAYVTSLMRGRRGAVIVSNPMTGEILAISNPERAFERAYPPGSTAKVVLSAAALDAGVVSPSDHILCRRVPELLGGAYHCSHPAAASAFTLAEALANSCNYFFAALSARVTSAALAHEYALFGFGTAAVGPGMNSNPGKVQVGDDAASKARAALGEGTVLATPAQLLLAYSALATRGQVFRLWRRPSRGSGIPLRQLGLKPETFEFLREGLEDCVRNGTGQGAAVQGVRVAGKTGTAAALDGSRVTHAWFAGFAPSDAPEIALVVFLERGTGARDAAPLAGKILNRYFAAKGRRP